MPHLYRLLPRLRTRRPADEYRTKEITAVIWGRRSCTCHPDDNPPVPCPQRFAYSECAKDAEAACQGDEIRSQRLFPRFTSPPAKVFDTATVRLGDGFISARFPPMRRRG